MMPRSQRVEAYLSLIGLPSRLEPTLETLAVLMQRHVETVPFENIDVFLRKPMTLGTKAALDKIITRRRGGFCFELNEAFHFLLGAIGFRTRRIEGRVFVADTGLFGAPFDHLALVVELPEGPFLADVGFGDGSRLPIRLPDGASTDCSGTYRLSPADDGDLLLSRVSGPQPRPLYRFSLAGQPLASFGAMFAFHQTAPQSIFTQGLVCTKATPDGRITITHRMLTLTTAGGQEKTPITDWEHCRRSLKEHFAIDAA